VLHCELGFRLRNSETPGLKDPDSVDFPEYPDFFPESPGFTLKKPNSQVLCISSIDHLSLPYPFTYSENEGEDPSQNRGTLHPKEDQG
jgi:hypothetical protein